MSRFAIVSLLLVVLVVGIGLGVAGRSVFDRWDAPPAALVAVPGPPTGAPPVATLPVPRVPTVPATPRDVVVEVTEGEAQTQLSSMLVGQPLGTTPLGDATIQSVTVAFRDRQVRVGGSARVGMLQSPFAATGTVAPNAAGRPTVTVSEATVGGIALPDAVRTALADSLQTQVDGLFDEHRVRVRAIDIVDGKLRLVGTPAGS